MAASFVKWRTRAMVFTSSDSNVRWTKTHLTAVVGAPPAVAAKTRCGKLIPTQGASYTSRTLDTICQKCIKKAEM